MVPGFFVGLYNFFHVRRALMFGIFIGSLLLLAWGASKLKFNEDVQNLLPNSQALKAMNDVALKSKAGDQLLFMVTSKSNAGDEVLMQAAEDLGTQLQQQAGSYFSSIQTQPGSGMEENLLPIIQNNIPLFLQPQDLAQLDSLTTLHAINRQLAQSKQLLLSPASVVYKQMIASDPIGMSNIIWKRLQSLNFDSGYESRDGYLMADSGRTLVMMATATNAAGATGQNKHLTDSLDKAIQLVVKDNPDIHIQYYGGPVVAAGNASQMRSDTILTLSITIILLLSVALYYFRNIRSPFLILIPVVYGALLGMCMVYIIKGSMALMALGAGAIVLGIAVDFSIHFLSHARHAQSAKKAVEELAQPLTLGSITTVLAFLILQFADTPILKDFGLFAGCSLIGAALATLIFLPHFISKKAQPHIAPNVFDKLGKWKPEKNKWLVAGIFLLTPFFLYWSTQVKFDSDMMHLNFLNKEVKAAEEKVTAISPGALNSIYLLAKGKSEEAALQQLQKVTPQLEQWQDDGKVSALSNPVYFLPTPALQRERSQHWQQYWTTEKITTLKQNITKAATQNGFNVVAFETFIQQLEHPDFSLSAEDQNVLKQLFPGGFAQDDQHHFAIAALKVPEQYRKELLSQFKGNKEVTLADRRLGAEQISELLKNDFNKIALYSSLIVFLALLIAYGRIELALFSFLPMVISWIWILGIMALLGIEFNIVNIIISSLIFGLGDDYSIFTMDGLIEKYKFKKEKINSVRSAIYISATTTIIGLGVLLLAKHPALKSIALISVPGMLCVLFISQTIQPFLFNWFIQKRADKGFMPFTLRSFFISLFAFTYFFVGSMLLTILGFLFTVLWPFNKEKGKKYLHVWLSRLTWSMMYIMGNVTKKVRSHGAVQSFKEPAIYIANHSSFLDILVTTMLTPNMVLLTNRWVWKSPVFGKVVKMAEYYPVADGADESIEPLRDLVKRGYNIMVFPEGTRSFTDKIHRFKKGAFYIAEQLQLNIVPVVLHGVNYTMQKGDWLLKDGTTSIHIYPPVTPADNQWGQAFYERTKGANRWMRNTLNHWKIKEETPKYFREQLIRSYTYKGPVLEWYCKIKTRIENNYESFHQWVPREGLIYDLGCGYGFMSYMLRWSAAGRSIIGVDYDDEKIATAQGNYLRDDKINFIQADISALEMLPCEAIVITDVLHYLSPGQQWKVLNQCDASLKSGGTFIIRDGIVEMEEKLKGTKLSELFSTRIFKFNKTTNDLHYISSNKIQEWAKEKGYTFELVDETKYTSNVVLILKKK